MKVTILICVTFVLERDNEPGWKKSIRSVGLLVQQITYSSQPTTKCPLSKKVLSFWSLPQGTFFSWNLPQNMFSKKLSSLQDESQGVGRGGYKGGLVDWEGPCKIGGRREAQVAPGLAFSHQDRAGQHMGRAVGMFLKDVHRCFSDLK